MPNQKKLLVETHFSEINHTTRNGKNGNMIAEVLLATAEEKNGNGRYYSRELWDREIAKYEELIQERRSVGELDHPESSIINLKNVSHLVTDYWWDGDKIMGKIEVLGDTPSGKILEALLKNKIMIGVSSRGMGSLEESGDVLEVQDDFELLCWDTVSTPSNHNSFMKVVNENIGSEYPKYQRVNSIVQEILCSKGQCNLENHVF